MWVDPNTINGISGHQRAEISIATSEHIGCFVGGAGTGKSHTIGRLVDAVIRQGNSVGMAMEGKFTFCAPTGKAASRVTQELEKLNITTLARTVHSTLGMRPQEGTADASAVSMDGTKWCFTYGPMKHLPCEYLICDETPMLDTTYFSRLIGALKPGTRVLFTGDPFQLLPVGHGRPFMDLIEAGIPTGHLTETHRFAGRIAKVCKAIRYGQEWEGSDKIDLKAECPENFLFVQASNTSQILQTIGRILEQTHGTFGVDSTQLLCTVNETSPVSRINLNSLLQRYYASKMATPGPVHETYGFRVGDKVMCKKNGNYRFLGSADEMAGKIEKANAQEKRKAAKKAKNQNGFDEGDNEDEGNPFEEAESTVYVANGEIGTVLDMVKNDILCAFNKRAVLFRSVKNEGARLVLAYGITVHNSQGSEWPLIIMPVDSSFGAGMVACRPLYYTGWSRAKVMLVAIGDKATVYQHCEKNPIDTRKTFLKELLGQWLPKPKTIVSLSAPIP